LEEKKKIANNSIKNLHIPIIDINIPPQINEKENKFERTQK